MPAPRPPLGLVFALFLLLTLPQGAVGEARRATSLPTLEPPPAAPGVRVDRAAAPLSAASTEGVPLSAAFAGGMPYRPLATAPDPDGLRIGITLGGISLMGLSLEYQWGSRSVDVTLGTWAFQDVSLSVVGKQYLGTGSLLPYFGIGLWGVTAFAPDGTGAALILRAPVGADWRILEEHAIGAAMNINRGLWVRRTDPTDETPLNRRLVPLPGFYYRWGPEGR